MSEKSETRNWPNIFGFGLLMGAADAVPGVSGGTIALIIGIYQKLISSISTCLDLIKNKFSLESKLKFLGAFNFLFPLGCGMLCSYYIVTRILIGPEDSPGLLRQDTTGPCIFAFFFGLVLFSIKEPWNLVYRPNFKHYILAVMGVLMVFIYTSFPESSNDSKVMLMVGGALALTAMLLPGVSGALVLLTLGQYHSIASSFHGGSLEPLMYLILGGIIGLFTFVPFMQYMISEYIDNTMAILTGLMSGSLITLWPWKKSYDIEGLSPNLGISQVFNDFEPITIITTFIFFVGGIAASYGLKQWKVKNDP